ARERKRLDVLADVVGAQDRRASLVRRDRRGDARAQRPGRRGRVAGELPERALAREADHERAAEREQDVEPPEQLEVVLDRLAEPDAGVEADAVFAHAVLDRE